MPGCKQSQSDPKVIYDLWLATLNNKARPSKSALTVMQWSKRLGKCRDKTRMWIREGLENGWMEQAPMTIVEITGRQRVGVGFRVVGKGRA